MRNTAITKQSRRKLPIANYIHEPHDNLQNTNAWIFSAPTKEALHILCNDVNTITNDIVGVGLLEIENGCQVMTQTRVITPKQNLGTLKNYFVHSATVTYKAETPRIIETTTTGITVICATIRIIIAMITIIMTKLYKNKVYSFLINQQENIEATTPNTNVETTPLHPERDQKVEND